MLTKMSLGLVLLAALAAGTFGVTSTNSTPAAKSGCCSSKNATCNAKGNCCEGCPDCKCEKECCDNCADGCHCQCEAQNVDKIGEIKVE
jgi:hypothetical protein